MKRWMEYLHFRRGTLGLIGLLAGIYWVMFVLYQIPTEPILYGFAIWLLAAGGLAIWDYLKFSKKHRTLLEVASRAEISLENLPEAANRLEQDYQDMVAGLFQAKCQKVLEYDGLLHHVGSSDQDSHSSHAPFDPVGAGPAVRGAFRSAL